MYELTQTFCPNLILYYSISNLVIFVMAQVEAQDRYGLKQSLYVKHDVYRFMLMTAFFFCLASVAQLTNYNFKMLVTFLACLKPLITAVKGYSEGKYKEVSNQLLFISGIMVICEILFMKVPFSLEGRE